MKYHTRFTLARKHLIIDKQDMSAGLKLRKALQKESPLQIVGVINAYAAKMAQDVGFLALYLSGAGVANSSFGIPDSGLTTLENIREDALRIVQAVGLPLLVDIDTGWDDPGKTIRVLENAGVAGVHIEDQVSDKKCGHLNSKGIISKSEMCERICACAEARKDPSLVIMARTDALANEGIDGSLERLMAYKHAGADMLFPEAMQDLDQYRIIKEATQLPVLANLTEFGKTPLFTLDELKSATIDMALYPLSANRAMNLAALRVFEEIRQKGTQKNILEIMQTREELYHFLNYKG